MLKLYKRTIIVSIWIFIILLTISIALKIFIPENDIISFIQNYIIGITCSILVVIITTFLQYKSEYERVMSEFTSILRQLILNLLVALSYQEKDAAELLCKEIIDKIKEDCDKLNQLNKSFCCFNKKLYQKYVELVKIIYKLYIPILSNSNDSYYDMLQDKIDYPTYIELAQKSYEFIDDDVNKKMIDELIKDAQQTIDKKKQFSETPKKDAISTKS